MAEDRIILALDGMGFIECVNLLNTLNRVPYAVKVHSLLDKEGLTAAEYLRLCGHKIWADLKLKDIPRTVGERAKIIKDIGGIDFLTVFADGGIDMMRAAVENGPEIIAVTVLTSLSPEEVKCKIGRAHV